MQQGLPGLSGGRVRGRQHTREIAREIIGFLSSLSLSTTEHPKSGKNLGQRTIRVEASY